METPIAGALGQARGSNGALTAVFMGEARSRLQGPDLFGWLRPKVVLALKDGASGFVIARCSYGPLTCRELCAVAQAVKRSYFT